MHLCVASFRSACTMHPPKVLLATVALLFASHVTSSVDLDDSVWRERLADVENLEFVKDTSDILNRFKAVGRSGKTSLVFGFEIL